MSPWLAPVCLRQFACVRRVRRRTQQQGTHGWPHSLLHAFLTRRPFISLILHLCSVCSPLTRLAAPRASPAHALSADAAKRVRSQLEVTARGMYSSPPLHGAAIVVEVLGDPQLYSQWRTELAGMAGRIKDMRAALHDALVQVMRAGVAAAGCAHARACLRAHACVRMQCADGCRRCR